MDKKIQQIIDVHKVQNSKGNWDSNEYMRGLANGLELALALLEEREPEYKSKK